MPKKCWCGNNQLEKYSEDYDKCNACHTLVCNKQVSEQIYDVKNEEQDLYGKNYWQKSMAEMSGLNSLDEIVDLYLRERAVYWLKYLLQYSLPKGKFAEIGCGLGQFSFLLKSIGFDQTAFELSPEVCDYIMKHLKINVVCGEFKESKGTYQTICAFDLIEHILDPIEFMKDVRTKLESGGILCFQTPCYDETLDFEQMLLLKPRFQQLLKPDQHPFIFSKKSITRLLSQTDFLNIQFEPPIFGEDYDMFLFASDEPFQKNSKNDIIEYLKNNSNPDILLVKALLNVYEEKEEVHFKWQESERDRADRLKVIEAFSKKLEESEKDNADRLSTIENLGKKLEESEKDRADRLSIIEELGKKLEESEKDRTERLYIIEHLNRALKDCENELKEKKNTLSQLESDFKDIKKLIIQIKNLIFSKDE